MKKFNKEESAIRYSATRAASRDNAKLAKRDYLAGAKAAENYYMHKLEEAKLILMRVSQSKYNSEDQLQEIENFLSK